MTASPTLADLFVQMPEKFIANGRPATREDILTVLRELGGVEVQADDLTVFAPAKACVHVHGVAPGRYLIIPLEES